MFLFHHSCSIFLVIILPSHGFHGRATFYRTLLEMEAINPEVHLVVRYGDLEVLHPLSPTFFCKTAFGSTCSTRFLYYYLVSLSF